MSSCWVSVAAKPAAAMADVEASMVEVAVAVVVACVVGVRGGDNGGGGGEGDGGGGEDAGDGCSFGGIAASVARRPLRVSRAVSSEPGLIPRGRGLWFAIFFCCEMNVSRLRCMRWMYSKLSYKSLPCTFPLVRSSRNVKFCPNLA